MRQWMLAGLAALLIAAPAWADVLKVPRDHGTLQEAVDAAGNGDTIVLAKGAYDQAVMIDGLSNLTIRGQGTVVLTPPPAGADETLRITNCPRIRLQGLTVANQAQVAIEIRDSPNARVERCNVQGSQGLTIAGASDGATVFKCKATTTEFGYAVEGEGSYVFEKCRADTSDGGAGFLVFGHVVRITKCRVASDTPPTQHMIAVAALTSAVVERCRVTTPDGVADIGGVFVDPASDPLATFLIERNKVTGPRTGMGGVADNMTLSRNRITAPGGGLFIEGDDAVVERNVIKADIGSGIALMGSDASISRNKITGGVSAVHLEGDTNFVEENKFKGQATGVLIEGGNGNTIGPGNKFKRVGTALDDNGTNTVEL